MHGIISWLIMVMVVSAAVGCASVADHGSRSDMDAMFLRLRTTHDRAEAETLEVAIRHVWARSGRDSIDQLMDQAATAVHAGDYDQAEDDLDKVVATDPDFVEGWDLRATVRYLKDDYMDAVGDIEHVLILEPRHFGALAALGRVMLALDDKKAALEAFRDALAINPYLDDVRDQVDTLEDELAGVPI